MNVVHLGQVRDLRAEWEKVRDAVTQGRVTGFYLTVLSDSGNEATYVGGTYKADPQLAARAALRMSMARMMEEDEEIVLPGKIVKQ
jgi:hypothetical protein